MGKSIELLEKDWVRLNRFVLPDKQESMSDDWVFAIKDGERDTKWNRLMYSKKIDVLRNQTISEWYSGNSQIGYGRE